MFDSLAETLAAEPAVAYGLVFGSRARGTARADSDLDVAIGATEALDHRRLGDLIGRLEAAAGCTVDLVVVGEAPAALRYRAFRDGTIVHERDRAQLVRDKARAILDYLDFRPVEDICVRGVLAAAAARGR